MAAYSTALHGASHVAGLCAALAGGILRGGILRHKGEAVPPTSPLEVILYYCMLSMAEFMTTLHGCLGTL